MLPLRLGPRAPDRLSGPGQLRLRAALRFEGAGRGSTTLGREGRRRSLLSIASRPAGRAGRASPLGTRGVWSLGGGSNPYSSEGQASRAQRGSPSGIWPGICPSKATRNAARAVAPEPGGPHCPSRGSLSRPATFARPPLARVRRTSSRPPPNGFAIPFADGLQPGSSRPASPSWSGFVGLGVIRPTRAICARRSARSAPSKARLAKLLVVARPPRARSAEAPFDPFWGASQVARRRRRWPAAPRQHLPPGPARASKWRFA
jgi:hypothetical protein